LVSRGRACRRREVRPPGQSCGWPAVEHVYDEGWSRPRGPRGSSRTRGSEGRMSIEELEESYGGPGPSGFDRTPPQDVAAEMSVLGGMLLSKDAIADVIEQIRGSDFYRPAQDRKSTR